MTYQEAFDYLNGFIDYERARRIGSMQKLMKLDRMHAVLELLGNPHERLQSVHVGGTNGKGSVCAMVESVLRTAGYRVGLYTSPGLLDYRERIMIDRRMIPEAEIVRHVERLKPCVEQMDTEELGEITYFEAITALGMDYFAAQQVDYAVLEVGMGGRLDATNVVNALVTGLTSIGVDHTSSLGHTIHEIAGEKAAIIKANGAVASAPQPEEAMSVIRSQCEAQQARLIELGKDLSFERIDFSPEGQRIRVDGAFGTHEDLQIQLIGAHQVINAATAFGGVGLLRERGVDVSDDALLKGFASATWPGRLQLLSDRPKILMDGGHNIDGARTLIKTIRETFSYDRLIFVFGMMSDKDIIGVWRELERLADMVFLTKSDNPRAADPATTAYRIGETNADVVTTESIPEAVDKALAAAGPDDLICVTGSLYLVGEAMTHLGVSVEE